MSHLGALFLGVCLGATGELSPAEALPGAWAIEGNGFHGELLVELHDGRVTGTIYGQPIEGDFDEQSSRVTFRRFVVRKNNDAVAVQEWSGVLTQVGHELPPRYLLQGAFHALGDPEFGASGVEFAWSGQAVRLPPPAVDLKRLQGQWQVAAITPCWDEDTHLPGETGLNEVSADVTIAGNQLVCGGQVVATLANDVASPALAGEVGFASYRPLLLTMSDGRALVCSYVIRADEIEIAYPHTTACHRGSGQIVSLRRPPE